MAFFDNLTKKASQASAKAIQKTKEFSDTTRLNSMISDEEDKITSNYREIGKLYTALHEHDYEDEFSAMIGFIKESEEKIGDYKKQIQEIKGIQNCEKCGGEVPKGAAFCNTCGATMPKVQEQIASDSVKCGNCGEEVGKEMRFCTSCGSPIAAEPLTIEQIPEEVNPADSIGEQEAAATVTQSPLEEEETNQEK